MACPPDSEPDGRLPAHKGNVKIIPYLEGRMTKKFIPRNKIVILHKTEPCSLCGFLILTEEEKDTLIKTKPLAEKYIRPYMMGKDFIQRKPRYCLWLVNAQLMRMYQKLTAK